MKILSRTPVCLFLIASGAICVAQNTTIPFKQIERSAVADQSRMLLASNANESSSDAPVSGVVAEYPAASTASSSVYMLQPTYKKDRVLDKKFFLVNGLHLGLAALDIGLTQHCIAAHRCREGNPLMPSSLGGQLAVDTVLVTSSTFISFHLKKQYSKMWWFSPSICRCGKRLHELLNLFGQVAIASRVKPEGVFTRCLPVRVCLRISIGSNRDGIDWCRRLSKGSFAEARRLANSRHQ